MLNYCALWIGVWAFGLGGPLHSDDPSDKSVPISNAVHGNAKLPVFWGDPELQGLHVGLFIALVALALFWVLLNRSVAGYEARAVGFNPDAAEYGGIHAGRTYTKVMLICGGFAGLAGAIDVLGWQFAVATNDIQNAGVVGAASSASRSRCSGATRRAASSSARSCSARSSTARRCATSIRRSSSPSWRRT